MQPIVDMVNKFGCILDNTCKPVVNLILRLLQDVCVEGNGNVMLTFADVSLFFHQVSWEMSLLYFAI